MTDPRDDQQAGDVVKPPLFSVMGAPAIPEGDIAAATAVPPKSPFDDLMITQEEAARRAQLPAPTSVKEEDEAPEADEPPILAEEVQKITKAIDRLARRGLNLKAVIALLHDSNPTISKKTIKMVLEGLRELPALYGRLPSSPDPLKQS